LQLYAYRRIAGSGQPSAPPTVPRTMPTAVCPGSP